MTGTYKHRAQKARMESHKGTITQRPSINLSAETSFIIQSIDLSQLHNCFIHFRLEDENLMKKILIKKVANAPTYPNRDRHFFSKRN